MDTNFVADVRIDDSDEVSELEPEFPEHVPRCLARKVESNSDGKPFYVKPTPMGVIRLSGEIGP